jgi:RNA polymerase sigma-70 factor, ECF subfamily
VIGLTCMVGAADDALLIARIAAGDAAALRGLMARYCVRVYRLVLRLVKNPAIAEELTNEVFLEIWLNAGSFAEASSAATWVLSVAHHRAVSSLRKRRENGWDEPTMLNVPDAADDPEMTAQKVDKSSALRRCIKALSPEHAAIIDIIYYHEMSVQETAAVLHIPENTVKTRLFHARKRLAELLKRAGIDRGWP